MTVIRLVISGRVQGVGFRWFVRQAAREGGLTGWVRNNADGSVELVAGGAAEAVSRFVESPLDRPGRCDEFQRRPRHHVIPGLPTQQHR